MAKNNLISKTGLFIKANKTALLYIGGAIVVVAFAIPIYKRFNSIINPKKMSATDSSAVKGIEVNKTKTTFTERQAKVFANQLVFYMSVSSGTDEAGIREVFEKVKNADDMNLLIKTFGIRPYSWVNGGEASGFLFGVLENLGGYGQLDLLGWLEQELGTFDRKTKNVVNEKLGYVGLSIS